MREFYSFSEENRLEEKARGNFPRVMT